MLILEDLINKMKLHFPKWMDIRRKINNSSGGQLLFSIGEEICDINDAIKEYKKDFFIDNYIGIEDDVISFLYKYHIGIIDLDNLKVNNYEVTTDENLFYSNNNYIYYEDGFLYLKEEVLNLEYYIDNYKSIASPEKIHVWNIFDEFAAFLGIRRYSFETNLELLNRTLAFSNNKVNSSEDGLKNAILNNLTNIDNSVTKDDIIIERPTPQNLIKYYDNFESILDHLSFINRDVYRTKRWDLDTWNFNIKSIDYIPHAWDVILDCYSNGIGFDSDLKVDIVDNNNITTNATIYFYKKTLEYINSYIKNNNIKDTIRLDLIKHNSDLIPENIKYRITATELENINVNNIYYNSFDYKIGEINQNIDDVFDEDINEYYNVDIIDNKILDPNKRYKLRFKSVNELKEMSIDKLVLYNKKTNTNKDIKINLNGFEYLTNGSIRCTLTKKYLTDKYHYSNVTNAHKELNGFVISDVQKNTELTAILEACQNEEIYYKYTYEEVPVLYHNINMYNCYVSESNDSILSDTVSGEKYISLKIKANSFSCNIHGPHKIVYALNNSSSYKTLSQETNDTYNFILKDNDMPIDMDIKIILNPKNNMQCAITDIMYSKYEFNISTEKGVITEISGQKRLPNYMDNKLFVHMKTYTGFSPVLEYIYIGTKLNNIIYGDIDIIPEDGDMLLINKTNCIAELETYTKFNNDNNDWRLDNFNGNYIASKVIIGKSNESYIDIDLSNFKSYKSIIADRCSFEIINQSHTIPKYRIKIPAGVYLSDLSIIGEYEKLLFKESLNLILKRKGFDSINYNFFICKNNENIIAINNEFGTNSFIKINKSDLLANNSSKVKFILNNNIQAIFIENESNKYSNILNEYDGYFNYISFYPTSTKIYKAINEYNIISPITKVPQIINTFDNDFKINTEYSLYYTIESLNNDYNVEFIKNNKTNNYAIDYSEILITKKDMNNLAFKYDSVTITYDSLLGNTIEIPDMFDIDKERIEVAKYIIYNKDLDIIYLNKYNDNSHEKDYIISEILTIDDLICNKLKYCNINEIEIIQDNSNNQIINNNYFELLKAEGIIKWKVDLKTLPNKIFIRYNINKPKYIRISLDELYKKVNYKTNAYELINKIDIYEIKDNDNFNLNIYEEYKDSDLISVKCSNIAFEATVKDNILKFNKNLKNNTIAVKTGYYYLDGDEYYLFADENKNNIESIDNLYFYNVIKENKLLYFNQTTTNLVANSSLKANANGTIFNLECNDKNIKGISKINSITTCENFNYWKSVGMNMSIEKGLNGLGIRFNSLNRFKGYSYLDISKYINDFKQNEKYIISFYLKGEENAYLGIEQRMYSEANEFNKQSVINLKNKAIKSLIEDNIYEIEFIYNINNKYYLIIEGNCLIDDIIIQKKEEYSIDDHIKNISTLNLDIIENIYANFETRLYLNDYKGAIFNGVEIKDEYITNSSYIDWGFTKYKEINDYNAFKHCELTNVDIIEHNDKCYIKTEKESGKIETSPIYLGNIKTIKNILYKINDVMFDHMKGFKIKILTSSNEITGYKEIGNYLDNISSINIDKLESYIKIIVEMPSNRVISNIELFIEYLSDDIYNPPEIPVINGIYISKVLDTQYNARYLIKDLNYEFNSKNNLNNIEFYIRASKENTENTVWTEWKPIKLELIEEEYKITNRLVFEDYRYFQFKVNLKGEGTSIKINNIDLEVI